MCDYPGSQAVCRALKGGSVASKGTRTNVGTTGPRKSKDALWVVFDNRLVLPEYIVEFDLLPANMQAPQTSIGGMDAPVPATSLLPDSSENFSSKQNSACEMSVQQGAPHQMQMADNSMQPDVSDATEVLGTSFQADSSSWMNELPCDASNDAAMCCETAASVAAVQRQAPEVARHCRKLGGFLLASEHVGSDTVNPALVPLPHRIRELAEQALQMPPLVRL